MGNILGAYKNTACCCGSDLDQVDSPALESGSIDEFLLEGVNTACIFMYAGIGSLASYNDVKYIIEMIPS